METKVGTTCSKKIAKTLFSASLGTQCNNTGLDATCKHRPLIISVQEPAVLIGRETDGFFIDGGLRYVATTATQHSPGSL